MTHAPRRSAPADEALPDGSANGPAKGPPDDLPDGPSGDRLARRAMTGRREILAGAAALAAAAPLLAVPAWARSLTPTPRQTEGPFYPDRFPVDRDADLLQVAGRARYAKGQPALVRGRLLDGTGRALPGFRVEIWQCDAGGHYHHSGDGGRADPDFQGYGHAMTGADGGYAFRTIRPAPYPGRTPHIHFKVSRGSRELLTTQLYIAGHPGNRRDFVLSRLSAAGRRTVVVPFRPAAEAGANTQLALFDIVLGQTVEG